ncbi:hypothetical protein SAMN04487830_1092 [Pseudobutyrivibrio sp. OR37]|uniref:DUF5711 family protein n=1 Tax=Pseudobutyrivibrio sp. OR37 TaxID=1798186 RepID=UPI0008F33B21|nr:DUF5711 family protein [Pseudobutyrivibrio sp. OR37]SFH80735.1 hypothetical protein SAMN04487830_1092 [Pseudobutyrivibrio sp. OR37]
MEEFKIIKLPEKKEEKTAEEVEIKKKPIKDDDYTPPKKRYLFLLLLLLIIVISIIVIRTVSTYEDFEVEKSWERQDSAESHYISYNNNLLKYSADGIFYTAFDGTLIWNYTYDMTNPSVDISGDYIVVYDKKGTEVDIFSSKGFIKSIATTTPVIEARVANQGTVAIMLQENSTTYIQMYDKKGTLLVSGEIHPENKGFPVSMALSSNATRLLLSIINVDDGEVSTELVFYDFTSAGKKEEDNIVASYQYIGTLIPKVDYVKNDKAIAFADSKIIVFNNNLKATVAKDITIDEQMKSVFYNDTHFGYICEKSLESGEVVNVLNVYNLYGFKSVSKELDNNYEYVSLLDNNIVMLKNENEIALYNLQGFEKFTYKFDDTVYDVIPTTAEKRYYIIQKNKTEEIYLK